MIGTAKDILKNVEVFSSSTINDSGSMWSAGIDVPGHQHVIEFHARSKELAEEMRDIVFNLVQTWVKGGLDEQCLAEEREACAVIAEGQGHYMCEDAQDTAKNIAELIRARSNP